MTKQSNEELCALAKAGDEQAFEQLLEQNERYMFAQIKRLHFPYKSYLKELKQCARIGTFRALQRYDPSRKTKFITYATYWIKKELMEFVREILSQSDEISISQCMEELLGLDKSYFRAERDIRPLEREVERKARLEMLEKCLGDLPPREKAFIQYRFGFLEEKPKRKAKMQKEFNLPKREADRMEEELLEYFRECLEDDFFYGYEGEDFVDIEARQKQVQKYYQSMFSGPTQNYAYDMMDSFDEEWEKEPQAQP